MAGIAEVARAAGVSKATASRAITGSGYVSETTRTRVLEAASALGYAPSTSAVSLATGRTQNIGVILPYVDRWFFAEVLEGIQDSLLREGLRPHALRRPTGDARAQAGLRGLPRTQDVRRSDRDRPRAGRP